MKNFNEILELANKGDAHAQCSVGECYQKGIEVEVIIKPHQ